jgi:acrylyl-CoA reductase (NADPH)
MFRAIVIEKDGQGPQRALVRELEEAELPAGDVTVRVEFSTLNYKDALAITATSPIIRSFPMVPGIDFAGTVEASDAPDVQVGAKVVLNGWGVGEKHWGGLAQKARVRGAWLVPLPARFSTREAMAIGTAGYTAMLAVMALERHGIAPASGPILVTGASGGVGSFAIALLAELGFHVMAVTGRPAEADYLKKLGATDIIDRAELAKPGRPLGKEQWAGAIDSVGSHTLANVCAGTRYGGAVAACGNAQGLDFPATVAPFILRGVSLLGIESVNRPRPDRLEAWRRLAELVKPARFEDIGHDIGLGEVIGAATQLLEGKIRGRLVVDVNRP